MIFTVYYRNPKTGIKDSLELDVPNKSAVWDVLKERKITAISIVEGKQKSQKSRNISFSPKAILIAAGTIVIGAILFIALSSKEKKTEVVPQKQTPKKEVKVETPKPIIPKTNATPVKVLSKREQKLKEIRDKYGDNIPDNYKAIVYFLENPPQKRFKAKGTHSYLRHPSERQIAGVVLVEPGTYFVIKPEFDASFDRDFVNALLDKNEPNEDDSEEVRMVKKEISEIKKEISDACRKEGRKPSEVLNDHAAAMYELGRYQRELEGELDKIYADPTLTDAEVEDFCAAANKMLESKGLKSLPLPNLTRRSVRLQHFQRMAERKAARNAEKEN